MNYLAHIYLSGPDPELQIGGLLGDFIKGPLCGALPERMEAGIHLHRRIDSITDAHPLFKQTLRSLPPPWRRFGGILLDVYFDHLLARQWQQFHSEPLEDFCETFYCQMENHYTFLPPRAQRFCKVAPEVKWLECYRESDNLPVMLNNVGRRFRKPVPLGDAWSLLQERDNEISNCFTILISQHKLYSAEFLSTLAVKTTSTEGFR